MEKGCQTEPPCRPLVTVMMLSAGILLVSPVWHLVELATRCQQHWTILVYALG